jgi:hypothetical protein
MTDEEMQAKIREIDAEMSVVSRNGDLRRARSVLVGTAFGGTTEITMRGIDGSVLWTPMQPVEVIELIHQLAANVGCHINLQPRQDFSSWRSWRTDNDEVKQLDGYPPSPKEAVDHKKLGQILPKPEDQPGTNFNRSKEHVVAIKKPANRRNTKRATKAS